jgi:hypothetical protein
LGVGLERKQWEQVREARAGDRLPSWAHDAGGPFVPPFDSCDREADMSEAYGYFAKKLGMGFDESGRPRKRSSPD